MFQPFNQSGRVKGPTLSYRSSVSTFPPIEEYNHNFLKKFKSHIGKTLQERCLKSIYFWSNHLNNFCLTSIAISNLLICVWIKVLAVKMKLVTIPDPTWRSKDFRGQGQWLVFTQLGDFLTLTLRTLEAKHRFLICFMVYLTLFPQSSCLLHYCFLSYPNSCLCIILICFMNHHSTWVEKRKKK